MRKKANFALRVFCLATVAACSVLIVRDLPTNAVETPGEAGFSAVATITWMHGRVWLKSAEYEKPEAVSSSRAVRDGAELRTLEGSLVQLRLPGTAGFVWLAPRSKARFGENAVTLIAGGVSVRRPEPTLRSLPRSAPAIRAGDFTVQADMEGEAQVIGPQNGKFKVKVLSGSVTLLSRTGAFVVRRNEEATFREKAGEAPKLGRLPFTLLSPRDGEPIPADLSKVRFAWNVDTAASEGRALELFVADSPAFRNVQQTYVVAASEPPLEYVEIQAKVPPARHPWYWKVRARGDDSFSYPERFWIPPRSGPELRYPLAEATAEAGAPVELVWDAVDNAQGYEVEVSGAVSRTPVPWLALSALPEGTTRWRVRAVLAGGELTPWSPSREIATR